MSEASGPVSDRGGSLRVAGLFAGIGGIERGLASAGHLSELLCEIDDAAATVLRERFPGTPVVGELHSTLNGRIDPLMIAAGSNRKLWWRCPRFGHAWQSTVHNRAAGWGCPNCAATAHARRLRKLARSQAQVPPERSLAIKRPELLAQLHPTRNRGLDPYAIGHGSHRKLWWRCGKCGHEWRATVASRAIQGAGCRRCFIKRHTQQLAQRNREHPPAIPIERSLAARHPELLAELHPTLNGELDPYSIGAGSHRRLWWRCPSGHEWQTTVNTRSRGCGCPECASQQPGRPRILARSRPRRRPGRLLLR